MSIEVSIYAFVQSQSSITSLVGNRVYPLAAAQGVTTPYIVLGAVQEQPIHHMGGPSDLTLKTFTVTALASSIASARQVANAVRLAFDGLADYTPPAGGVVIRAVLKQNERTSVSPDDTGGQAHTYQIDTDYRVHHRQTI